MQRTQLTIIYRFILLLIFDEIFPFQVQAIIGGTDAQKGEFTYQVAIKLKKKYICGGGIIGEKFVITAAHCVAYRDGDFREGPMRIIARFTDVNDIDDWRRVEVDVDKAYIPNRYGGSKNVGDIAVIRTKQPLRLQSNYLTPLYLARQVDETYMGETAVIAGIGWDEITSTYGYGLAPFVKENGTQSGLLTWSRTKILAYDECVFRGHYFVRDSHLCARLVRPGQLPYGICSGDSGGPLVHETRILIGVAIASPPSCNEAYFPGLYTRITSYLTFINNALNDTVKDMRTKIYENSSEVEHEIVCLKEPCQSTGTKYNVTV